MQISLYESSMIIREFIQSLLFYQQISWNVIHESAQTALSLLIANAMPFVSYTFCNNLADIQLPNIDSRQ